jgi:hypothetical protein
MIKILFVCWGSICDASEFPINKGFRRIFTHGLHGLEQQVSRSEPNEDNLILRALFTRCLNSITGFIVYKEVCVPGAIWIHGLLYLFMFD